MKTKIMLNTPQDVEEFVNAASGCDGEVDLTGGVVYIDGKSFLGVLTMGLKRELNVHTTELSPRFKEVVKKYQIA